MKKQIQEIKELVYLNNEMYDEAVDVIFDGDMVIFYILFGNTKYYFIDNIGYIYSMYFNVYTFHNYLSEASWDLWG